MGRQALPAPEVRTPSLPLQQPRVSLCGQQLQGRQRAGLGTRPRAAARILTGHTQSVTCLRWGGDGLLYSASQDRTIKVWAHDVRAGKGPEPAWEIAGQGCQTSVS